MQVNGAKVRLRDWRPEDMEVFRAAMAPDRPWQRLDAPYYPKPAGAALEALLEAKRGRMTRGPGDTVRDELVIADPATDRMIGLVTWHWISEETRWPGIGIVIYETDAWGKGKGTESLRLWCGYLFTTLPQIQRLDLRTWSGNAPMCRVAAKLGFVEEARFRNARIVDGAYFDSVGFGILREEWAQAEYLCKPAP